MKTKLLLLLLLISNIFAQQNYYTLSELNGMEDQNGNTHLFYRLYKYFEFPHIFIENSIYHLDLSSDNDSLFLYDGGWLNEDYLEISNLKFWNNKPSEFIYSGYHSDVNDYGGFFQRYDMETRYDVWAGMIFDLEISQQNDSIIYACAFNKGSYGYNWYISTDGGRNWETFLWYVNNDRRFISLSPFNDQVIFITQNYSLYKSTDSGINFFIADPSHAHIADLYYDIDSTHIYSVQYFANNPSYSLKVSNNEGNISSWSEIYSSSNKINISLDHSQSGKLFLADGNGIYISENYGLSFNEYKILDSNIVGIYKKPLSNLLYAATKHHLFEITPDSIRIIKHIVLNVEDEKNQINKYFLSQNFPNPFNPTTTISFSIPQSQNIELKVFDVLGNEVVTLLNEYKESGEHKVEFSAIGGYTYSLPSGIYFYKLKAGDFIQTKKMLLLK